MLEEMDSGLAIPDESADDGEPLETMLLVVCINFVFGRDYRIRMIASTLDSSSSDVTLSSTPRPFTPPPVEFLDIATIHVPPSSFPHGKNAPSFIYPFRSHIVLDLLLYHQSLIRSLCYVSLPLVLCPFYMCISCGFSVIIHIQVWRRNNCHKVARHDHFPRMGRILAAEQGPPDGKFVVVPRNPSTVHGRVAGIP